LAQQIAAETGAKVKPDLYMESTSGHNGSAPTYIYDKHDVNGFMDALE